MEGFSKDGRKLRPRKSNAAVTAHSEKVDFTSPSEQESYPERGSFGEKPAYGERRNYGDRPAYGERRSYGDKPARSYGDRPAYGERKSYSSEGGERRSYGDKSARSYGDRPAYGERKSYSSEGGERRSYGDKPARSYGDRPAYGERKSFGNKPGFNKGPKDGKKPFAKRSASSFSKESNVGINKMICRRPLLNNQSIGDFDAIPNTIQSEIRLNRFIANSGVCSRREADTLIQAGVVTVNGEVVTELGTKVNIFDDDVRFNGERLKGEEKVYIVMNKPKGYVTTANDPHAEKTVLNLVKDCTTRVYPVGRLDKNTTGVLMLTNDGEIAERLTHPSYDKKKIYKVALDRELAQEDFDKIVAGINLTDGDVSADSLEYIDEGDHRKLGIEIHSGKNRIVRRIFESLGYTVKALDRVYFAGLTKKGLKKGEWRYLSENEVNILRMGAYV